MAPKTTSGSGWKDKTHVSLFIIIFFSTVDRTAHFLQCSIFVLLVPNALIREKCRLNCVQLSISEVVILTMIACVRVSVT